MKRIAQIFLVILLINLPLEAQKSNKANNSSETRIKELEARVDTLETKLAEVINYLNATNQSKQVKQEKNFTLTLRISQENWKKNGQAYYDEIMKKIKIANNLKYSNSWLFYVGSGYPDGKSLDNKGRPIQAVPIYNYNMAIGFFASKTEAMIFYTEHFQNYKEMELNDISVIED